jgi:hypothetical protein
MRENEDPKNRIRHARDIRDTPAYQPLARKLKADEIHRTVTYILQVLARMTKPDYIIVLANPKNQKDKTLPYLTMAIQLPSPLDQIYLLPIEERLGIIIRTEAVLTASPGEGLKPAKVSCPFIKVLDRQETDVFIQYDGFLETLLDLIEGISCSN